jgi:hypothetical protein
MCFLGLAVYRSHQEFPPLALSEKWYLWTVTGSNHSRLSHSNWLTQANLLAKYHDAATMGEQVIANEVCKD